MSLESRFEDIYKNRFMLAAILLIVAVSLAAIYYIMPLADGIIFGVFFFFVTRPIKEYLDKYTKFSPYIATFCILIPLIAIIIYGIIAVATEVRWAAGHGAELTAILDQTEERLGLPFDLNEAVSEALKNLYDYSITLLKSLPIRSTVSSAVSLAMNALISLFVCFYLLKDGRGFVRSLKELTPDSQRPVLDAFLAEADCILSGIFTGTFYTALFVAAGSLIIFTAFNIPYKALFTAFVFIAAMVPILSGMMVFLPLTLYVYLYRSPLIAALFLGTAVVFVYLPPDFIIRPYLINRASNLHPLLTILAFIGGGVAAGLSGFFAAPMAVGLVTAAYRTYKKKVKGDESLH
ncbi:putative permease [Methanocella conradii HZ254]|uniref:Permease n=1 Tax=Methanocella conradii (strain DSM 24694 / JCM 17849 / CGMCC 1.5162 / HZ254) TaxID=1041930 RepID=H8I4A4_METCZ|nr:AI-2E family transporter [Methanocella conradii]AFC99661.1 putative permease [Methanocella conradii HZ254]